MEFKEMEEAFASQTPEEKEKKVAEIIARLKGENFGSKEQRSQFGAMFGSLVREANGGNKEASSYIRTLGKVLSNWGQGDFEKPISESSYSSFGRQKDSKHGTFKGVK